MVRPGFKLDGARPFKLPLSRLTKLALALFALLTAIPLAGCQHTGTASGATSLKVVCRPWRPIYYSKKDTSKTQNQVRIHNGTGERLRCW
jgi:hypothetical protein